MSTITNILGTDNITDSRAVINTNFTNLNTDKIEASAIANFETTTQLNARDTANRNRANHTGTQTASTISDFDTEVSNNTDVSANTSARHTHSNKSLLDTYTQTEIDLADAVTKKHTHSNKTILDNTTASFTTADETKLDGIEANANNYSLPTASTTILGGVKVDGTTITITGGVISSTGGGGGSGDVTGPASSTNNGVVLFDGTTGKIIKDSAKTIVTTLGGDDTTIPTSKAVADAIGSAGGGDMLKSVYDTNNDGIVNQADVITSQGDLATLDSVDTAQITNSAVTNGKLAHMNANTVKGRLSGNGTPQDVAMADLPISTATQTALDGKENTITAGTTSQYYRGDKSFQTLDKSAVGLSNVDNTSDSTKNSATATLTNKTISGASNTLSAIPQSAVTNLTTDLSGKQATLVSGTNIKTINGNSILGSGDLVISGGSSTKQHRITIPGELIADTSNYQGLYFYNDTGATITISNVAFAVGTASAGSGAALACNIYKSSGTASDGLNTNAVNLFTSAVSLGTSYTSLTNVPNTTTVENGRWVTLRVTSSAGGTNRASNLQAIISYS